MYHPQPPGGIGSTSKKHVPRALIWTLASLGAIAVVLAVTIVVVVATNNNSHEDDQPATESWSSAFSLEDALAEVCVHGTYVDGEAAFLRNAKTAGNCRGDESYI